MPFASGQTMVNTNCRVDELIGRILAALPGTSVMDEAPKSQVTSHYFAARGTLHTESGWQA